MIGRDRGGGGRDEASRGAGGTLAGVALGGGLRTSFDSNESCVGAEVTVCFALGAAALRFVGFKGAGVGTASSTSRLTPFPLSPAIPFRFGELPASVVVPGRETELLNRLLGW